MSTADLINTLDSWKSPVVSVVGDLILDHYVFGNVSRISPEAPIPVLHVKKEEDRLGGAANVAANLLSLGSRARLVGVLGKDEGGDRFARLTDGIDGLTLKRVNSKVHPTILKTRLVSQNQQMLRVDREELQDFDDTTRERLQRAALAAIKTSKAVVISDYAKGVITDKFAQTLIKAANNAKIPVLVDPKGTDYSRYRGATVVTPNRGEAEAATGIQCKTLDDVERAGRKLIKELRLEAAVITLSAEGVAVIPKRGKLAHFPAQARGVFDVTGAGDTFIATLSLALAQGTDVETGARLANAAGALKVARFGAVGITRDELRRSVLGAHEGFDHAGKVVTNDELTEALETHRTNGERIVFTNGCFDLLHQGHVTYLNWCRGQGDVVVVGLNADASVSRIKGPTRPVNDEISRARVLAALADVDYVCIFREDTPEDLIRLTRPDVLVKGEDWRGKTVAGAKFVERHGGRVAFAPLVEGKSTTNMIKRAKSSTRKKATR